MYQYLSPTIIDKKNYFSRGQGEAGYTLVELLVALTILAMVVAPVFNMFVTGYQLLILSGKRTEAVNYSREQMELVKARGYQHAYEFYLAEGNNPYTEEVQGSYGDYSRRTTVEKPTNQPGEEGNHGENYPLKAPVLQLEVEVIWEEREKEHSVMVTSYLAGGE